MGGFPDLDLSFLFCPFLALLGRSRLGRSRFFRDSPDLLGDGPGIFPIRPFSLSRPIKSIKKRSPTRSSPERVRDTIWTFPEKSGKPPGLETPRFSFSQILKTLQFKTLRFRGAEPRLKERGQAMCQNAAYLEGICDLELQLRATTGSRGAIWQIA